MSRIPMPKVSLLMLAMGGALLLGQQVAGAEMAHEPTVVLTVPAANVSPAGGAHAFVADMNVDDAAAPAMR